jgi:hypothetical protein
VAPVYEPEIAADAIVWAATHRRRELWVGGSTVAVILGNKLAAGLADRYLARTSVEAQQTDEPLPPDRRDDLFEPVGEDRGARGPFTNEATDGSWQWCASRHRTALAAATAGLALSARALRRR